MIKGRLTVVVQHHTLLTSALYGTEWSTTRPGRFTQLRAPLCDLNWRGLGAGPVARLDDLEKRQSLDPVYNRTPLPILQTELHTNTVHTTVFVVHTVDII